MNAGDRVFRGADDQLESRGTIKMKITDEDIRERIREYELALRTEVEASRSVREAWRKMVGMFNELLERRGKND